VVWLWFPLEVSAESPKRVVTDIRHQGLPVVGGRLAARIPQNLDVMPALTEGDVWQRVGGQGTAELVVDAEPLGTRLSYRVFTWDGRNPMSLQRIFVDAKNGVVYRREPMVWTAHKANVFAENPKKTPKLVEVQLTGIPPSQEFLASNEVAAFSCLEPEACVKDENGQYFYDCNVDYAAKQDANGDFKESFPGHTAPGDGLAEVNAYYHLTRAYDVVRDLTGIQDVIQGGLTAVANFRMVQDPLACQNETFVGQGFMPFDNAAFVPGGFGLLPTPHGGILIGQGSSIDFAYDGDVLIHEFGHGYHHRVAPELSWGFIDNYGLNSMPGGLMEGYADLLTLALTDDPNIGEYAGGQEPIRVIANERRCPDDLTGEPHMDSEIFTGAVYEARAAIAKTKKLKTSFDKAVLLSVVGISAYDDFEQAATALVAEVKKELDDSAAQKTKSILQKRGLFGCENRIVTAKEKQFVWMEGYAAGQNTPGPVQFRYELSEPAEKLGVGLGYMPPELAGNLVMVVRRGKTPITWKQSATGPVGTYDWEQPFAVIPNSDQGGAAVLEGTFPPDTYYIQFVHRGEGQHPIAGIQFVHAGASLSPNVDWYAAELTQADETDAAGCAATNGGAAGQGMVIVILFALLSFRRERRSSLRIS
jgi:hypothetical protein